MTSEITQQQLLRRRRPLVSAEWATIGEEIAVWAALREDEVDEDWLGRTLRGEEIGGYIPVGHTTSQQIWEAVEYYSWGWTVEDIADEMGMSPEGVFTWFRCAKIRRRPTWTHHRPPYPWWLPAPWWQLYDDALRATVLERAQVTPGMVRAYRHGLDIRAIAELWGVISKSTVHRRFVRAGVITRPRWQRPEVPYKTFAYFQEVARTELEKAMEHNRKAHSHQQEGRTW